MRGRKPSLQLIEGGAAAGRCPSAPVWLSDHAKAEWKRVAPQLHGRSLLAQDTLATVENYCVAVGTVRELEDVMRAEGRLVQTEDGPATHPAFRMQGAAMREARLLAAELGLTPHRRKGAPEKGAGDGWDDLLA